MPNWKFFRNWHTCGWKIIFFFLKMFFRQEIIERLQNSHSLVILVSDSLKMYIDNVRKLVSQHPELDSATFCPDNRYCHELQVQERLNFLRFLLKVNFRINKAVAEL